MGRVRYSSIFSRHPTRSLGLELKAYGVEERGTEQGGLPGPHWSQVSAKAASAGGVPVGGKGGTLCQVGQGLLLEIPPIYSTAKSSSQFCALAMVKRGATEGAYRISLLPLTHQQQRRGRRGAVRLRQEEVQTVIVNGRGIIGRMWAKETRNRMKKRSEGVCFSIRVW